MVGEGGNGARRAPALTARTLREGVAVLSDQDPGLARIVAAHGVPAFWRRPQGFETLVRIILEQQVSLESAATLYARVAEALGGMSPTVVTEAGEERLRQHGLTRQKARYVVALAEQVESGALSLSALARTDDAEAAERLMRVPGIGPWSAGVYQLVALRRPDVWPPGDLALHLALKQLRALKAAPSSAVAERMAERWAPWRAVAARILWRGYLAERNRSG